MLWALVAVVAVLGMHVAVVAVDAGAPAMAGMAATPATAPHAGEMATVVLQGPAAPSVPLPGGQHHDPTAAACAAVLGVVGVALLVLPFWPRARRDLPGRVALGVGALGRDRWAVGVPVPVRLCVSRT